MPFSQSNLGILFPLFVVLEEHRAALGTHTGIILEATFVCLNGFAMP